MNDYHVTCADCGIVFCMPKGLADARHRDGGAFYCPNGHSLSWKPTRDEIRIAELEEKLARRDRSLRDQGDRFSELLAQKEELIGLLKECPGRCGWRSRKQVPRDPIGMGRGLERVRVDVAQHLVEVHGAQPVVSEPRQLEAGA